MVKEIIEFPDKRIHVITADLREFDDALISLIQDMKDTMNEHNLDALAANQIAVHKPVILLREENGDFLEIINPRELSKKEKFMSTESTLYYPDISTDVMRFKHLKIVYQDRFGKQQFLTADGERSIVLQRKIDYCFGATLANRINPKVREVFERQVGIAEHCSDEICPTQPLKRDFIKSFMTKLLFLEFLTLFSKLFNFQNETLQSFYSFDKYVSIAMIFLLILYAIVGYKESKIYTNCSTCNLSYVVMTAIQYAVIATVLYIASRFLVIP
jgi:peptide deformylase